MTNWRGDLIREEVSKGAIMSCDDLNGWNFCSLPMPRDRPIWVITEFQRRCLVLNGMFWKWAILDSQHYLWHPSEVKDITRPPDFPTELSFTNPNEK